jgi:hypothetical protein
MQPSDEHAPAPAAFYSIPPQGGPQRGALPPPVPHSNSNTGYGFGSSNYKGKKRKTGGGVAPPAAHAFPSPQNLWTGAIHMYPMMGARPAMPFYHNPTGVLGPRLAPPRPAPQGYMVLPAPPAPATYTYPGHPTYGSSSAPT